MLKFFYLLLVQLAVVATVNSQTLSTVAGVGGSKGSDDGNANSAKFQNPTGVAVDSAGNIWVADQFNSTIRLITPDGKVHTRAGAPEMHAHSDASGITSRFFFPVGVAIGANNEIYVADFGNKVIRKISPFISLGSVQEVTTIAGAPGQNGSTDGTGSAARFNYISGIATAPNGDIYITERDLHTVRKITPAGVVTTYAGASGVSGNDDGSLTNARFYRPNGITVAANGDIYVTESGNGRIRKISNGQVTTVAGGNMNYSKDGHINDPDTTKRPGFFVPFGVLAMAGGEVYVADTRCRLRRIYNDSVSTVAGIYDDCGYTDGPALSSKLFGPQGLALSKDGTKIIIADMANHAIRAYSFTGGNDTGTVGLPANKTLQVNIYPNPVSDIVNVEIPGHTGGTLMVSLYDLNGRKIFTHDLKESGNKLNLQNLNRGMYLIRVQQEGEAVFSRIIHKN